MIMSLVTPALIVVTYLLLAAAGYVVTSWSFTPDASGFVFLPFALVGALILWRKPRNVIGWLLSTTALSAGLGSFAQQYALYGIVTAGGPFPLVGLAAWLASWVWGVLLGSLLLLTFLFPTGRPVTPGWTPVVAICVGLISINTVVSAFSPSTAFALSWRGFHPELTNPLGFEALRSIQEALRESGWALLLLLGIAFVSVIARFRRASGIESQQMKWGLGGFGVFLLSLAVGRALTGSAYDVAAAIAVGAIPSSIGIAVLRHRLYDIDLLINRTLVYGATSGAIALTFFAGIVALQTLLRPLTAGSELAVAASTLASFALFQPLRRRVQAAVDRRFDRSRYDAARSVEVFADRLRDQVDLAALRSDLLAAVRETMAPVHASLWLRERGAREGALRDRRP